MSFRIFITRDFDHMSRVASDVVEADIRHKQAVKREYVLGLATGNSPTGLYRNLAKAFNEGRIDASRVRSFNLDEYVGLPGENAQQRALHPESYSYFMIQELFGLLETKFAETNVPWGTLIDQEELVTALEAHAGDFEMQGTDKGKAVVIRDGADGVLGWIKNNVLDAYERKIERFGGIDLHIVGVGGRGHVAFHESGIPFAGNRMLLVALDDSTVANAVADGHFASREESPRYAVTMGVELVYQAKEVILLASGSRKTEPVIESLLGDPSPAVPISYGKVYAQSGGRLFYVLDREAGRKVLEQADRIRRQGIEIEDISGPAIVQPVLDLPFFRDPETSPLR